MYLDTIQNKYWQMQDKVVILLKKKKEESKKDKNTKQIAEKINDRYISVEKY